MAMSKWVKVGGSYYNGASLPVDSAAADYVLDMAFTAAGAVNAISIVPSAFGSGDTFKVEHLDTASNVSAVLAASIPNVGANAAWRFEFPSLEKVLPNETIRVTYTNTASVSMTVYTVLERIQ